MPYYVEKLAVLAPLIMRLYEGTPLYNNLGLIEIFFWGPRGCKLKFTAGERERESVCVCVFVRGKQQLRLQDGVR